MSAVPQHPGFYWGRWHTPENGADHGFDQDGEICTGLDWEVHMVACDRTDCTGKRLVAFVPGVEKTQPLEAFEWGEEVTRN